jgi:hypothetical protein
MFCSGCGQALSARADASARSVAVPWQCSRFPRCRASQFQVHNYAGRVRTLAIAWLVLCRLSTLLSRSGSALTFMNAFFAGHLGPWMGMSQEGVTGAPSLLSSLTGMRLVQFTWLAVLALRPGAGRRLGPAGTRAVGPHRRHRRRLPQPAQHSPSEPPWASGPWSCFGYKNSTLYEQLSQLPAASSSATSRPPGVPTASPALTQTISFRKSSGLEAKS